MDYRELLSRCKSDPGCLADRQQKRVDSQFNYYEWMQRANEEYEMQRSLRKEKESHE